MRDLWIYRWMFILFYFLPSGTGLYTLTIGQIDDAQRISRSAQEDCDIEKAKAKAIADQARKEALSLRKALDEAISR